MEKEEKRILGAQEILFYAMNEPSPMHFLMAARYDGNLVLTNSSRYLVTGLLKAIEAKIHNAIK